MAGQQALNPLLLDLSDSGALQKPADEGNPQPVDKVAAKHLPCQNLLPSYAFHKSKSPLILAQNQAKMTNSQPLYVLFLNILPSYAFNSLTKNGVITPLTMLQTTPIGA